MKGPDEFPEFEAEAVKLRRLQADRDKLQKELDRLESESAQGALVQEAAELLKGCGTSQARSRPEVIRDLRHKLVVIREAIRMQTAALDEVKVRLYRDQLLPDLRARNQAEIRDVLESVLGVLSANERMARSYYQLRAAGWPTHGLFWVYGLFGHDFEVFKRVVKAWANNLISRGIVTKDDPLVTKLLTASRPALDLSLPVTREAFVAAKEMSYETR
jgi:hypothetical protein